MKEQIREIIFSFPSDGEITKHVNDIDTPEGQDQFTHDTAFVKGAIWMREQISSILESSKIDNNETKDLLIAMLESQLKVEKVNCDSYEYAYNTNQHFEVKQICNVHLLACRKRRNEIERQLNELKG